MKKITKINILLVFHCLFVLFHLSILSGLVSYGNVWGGRLESEQQMLVFESISIVVVSSFIVLFYQKRKQLLAGLSHKITNRFLVVLGFIYSLNTIGNLMSISVMEQWIFTPITLVLAIWCFQLRKT